MSLHHSPRFISSPRHFIISYHHWKKGEYSMRTHCDRETTFTYFVLQYNCSVLLLVTVVNLLLCLIYKLNIITGMCVQKKQYLQSTVYIFRHPLVILGCIPNVQWKIMILQTTVFSMELTILSSFLPWRKQKLGHLYILTIYIGTFVAVDDKIHSK